MNLEEINSQIKQMGYTPFIPKMEVPNYYRLEDGTILRIFAIMNSIVFDPAQPNNASVNAQNVIACFVPPKLRGSSSLRQYTFADYQANMDIADMEFDILSENFNTYEVDGRWILNVKSTLSQVGKTKLFNGFGEPVYVVNTTPVPKLKPKQ